jgi:hypothetical protein
MAIEEKAVCAGAQDNSDDAYVDLLVSWLNSAWSGTGIRGGSKSCTVLEDRPTC